MGMLWAGALYVAGGLAVVLALADTALDRFDKAKTVLGWMYRAGGRWRKLHRVITSPSGRFALLVVGLVVIYSGREIHTRTEGPLLAERKKQLESNVMLVEAYPHYHWKLTGTARGSYPLDGSTLTSSLNDATDDRLTPMIRNRNDGVPLTGAEMFVRFSSNIRLTTMPTMWKPLDAPPGFQEWWAKLADDGTVPGDVDGGSYGINESLMAEFPGPDTYPVTWRITGTASGISR